MHPCRGHLLKACGKSPSQSTRAAKTLYNGKILALKSNLSQLQAQIEKKSDNANAVVEMIQFKMTQQQQAQKAGAA